MVAATTLGTAGMVLPIVAAPSATQQGPAASPKFAVVSIKQSGADERTDLTAALSGSMLPGIWPHGVFRINHVSLFNVIVSAYRDEMVEPLAQISGIPAWANWNTNTYFDIYAKPDDAFPDMPYLQNVTQVGLMLQAMLADRFYLKLHRESRMFEGYRLEVTPGGQRKLTPATLNDDGMAVDPRFGPGPFVPGWSHQGPAGPGGLWWLGSPAISMQDFGKSVSGMLDEPVVDGTALQGLFSIRVEWQAGGHIGRGGSFEEFPAALEQQYGLRLVTAKVPLQVFVVDSVSLPTPN